MCGLQMSSTWQRTCTGRRRTPKVEVDISGADWFFCVAFQYAANTLSYTHTHTHARTHTHTHTHHPCMHTRRHSCTQMYKQTHNSHYTLNGECVTPNNSISRIPDSCIHTLHLIQLCTHTDGDSTDRSPQSNSTCHTRSAMNMRLQHNKHTWQWQHWCGLHMVITRKESQTLIVYSNSNTAYRLTSDNMPIRPI